MNVCMLFFGLFGYDGLDEIIDIVIIGIGFVGFGMVICLKQMGVIDFVVFEKVVLVGGMWCDNYYFGCVCDV